MQERLNFSRLESRGIYILVIEFLWKPWKLIKMTKTFAKCFLRVNDTFQIIKTIRETIIFTRMKIPIS